MTDPTATRPAMGGRATVVVAGPRPLLETGHRRLADLEARWSRFRPDSEISRLNAARDVPLAVSADTRLLVRRALDARTATAGAFDPTILDALVAWGYDRDLADIGPEPRPVGDSRPRGPRPPAHEAVEVDDVAGTVCLGGNGFDPGGIGKGLAADLVATALVEAGAEGALVEVAGDLRVAGCPPEPGWVVGVEDPRSPEQDLLRMTLAGGGLATSSDRRRRWRMEDADGERDVHHLIDPRRGAPARASLAGVTVLAGEAWWAEALTKAVLVGGMAVAALPDLGASGIGRSHDGALVATADLAVLRGEAA